MFFDALSNNQGHKLLCVKQQNKYFFPFSERREQIIKLCFLPECPVISNFMVTRSKSNFPTIVPFRIFWLVLTPHGKAWWNSTHWRGSLKHWHTRAWEVPRRNVPFAGMQVHHMLQNIVFSISLVLLFHLVLLKILECVHFPGWKYILIDQLFA